MATTGYTVTRPSAADVVQWTGLNQYIEGHTSAEFGAWIEGLVPDAEDEVAIIVGEDTYDGDGWTRRQARIVARAVAYYTAAAALVSPELQVATGTHEPLLMDDPEAIAEVAARLRARGKTLLNQATAGEDAEPFALPAVSSSTFAGSDSDTLPSEKNDLLDERDDLGAHRTDLL